MYSLFFIEFSVMCIFFDYFFSSFLPISKTILLKTIDTDVVFDSIFNCGCCAFWFEFLLLFILCKYCKLNLKSHRLDSEKKKKCFNIELNRFEKNAHPK